MNGILTMIKYAKYKFNNKKKKNVIFFVSVFFMEHLFTSCGILVSGEMLF